MLNHEEMMQMYELRQWNVFFAFNAASNVYAFKMCRFPAIKHLECRPVRNWCHHFLCRYYSYVLCTFSRKPANFPPVLCERWNAMRQKKLWIFSLFPLSKNAVFLQLFSHEGDVLKAPKLTVFLSKTNAFLNMPGRAGRVSKGYCYRLVTKRFWNKEIPDHMVPDMLVSVWFFLPPFYSTQTLQLSLALLQLRR